MLFHLGKLLLQCGNPVPDQTTVCLQLFLTGASGSDSSSKSRKRRTKSHKTCRPVTKLCKLYLDLAFTCDSTLRKNVKDQQGTIHNLALQLPLQIIHLGRRKLIVTDHTIGIQGIEKTFYLFDLAFSDIGARMYGLTILNDPACNRRTCRSRKFSKLIQGFLHVIPPICLDTDQDNPVLYFLKIFHISPPKTFWFSGKPALFLQRNLQGTSQYIPGPWSVQ